MLESTSLIFISNFNIIFCSENQWAGVLKAKSQNIRILYTVFSHIRIWKWFLFQIFLDKVIR